MVAGSFRRYFMKFRRIYGEFRRHYRGVFGDFGGSEVRYLESRGFHEIFEEI